MEQHPSVQLLDSMPILELGGWPPPHRFHPCAQALASQVGFRRQPTVDIGHPIPPGTSPPGERALEGTSAWALPLVHERMPVGTRAYTQAYTHTRRNTLKHACTHARDQSLQTDAQAGGHPDAHPHKRARTAHTHNHAKMHTLPSRQRQKQTKSQTHVRIHKHAGTTHTHKHKGA